MRGTDKIDQTIEAICDHIQRLIQADQTEEAAKLTKALTVLVTARGNLKIADFKVCEEHDYQDGVKSDREIKNVNQQQSKNGVSGMMIGGAPEAKYVIPCPKPKKTAIQNSFGEEVIRLGMKGCKTIAEYAIRQWLTTQGFQMAFFNLNVHENEGVLIDHNGDTLLLIYDRETKSVYAKE